MLCNFKTTPKVFSPLKKLEGTVKKMNMLIPISANPVETFLKHSGEFLLINTRQIGCTITFLC